MKTNIILAAAALLSLAACNKEQGLEFPAQPSTSERTPLTVSISSPMTKATGVSADDEAKVNTLQVLVFNGDALDAYGKASGTSQITLSCTAGERAVYAVVNAEEDFDGISSKAAFLAKGSKLAGNSLSGFVMAGSTTANLPSTAAVNIDVNRIAARMMVKKITSAFEGAQAGVDFTVDAIYATNVAGEQAKLFEANAALAADATWFNKMKWETSAADALVKDALTGVNLKGAKSHDTAHSFYVYPNPSEDDENAGAWSPRHTRLVIEATIAGTKYYYPLTMPKLQSNKSYEINEVIIKHLGSSDPDTPVSASDVAFQVTVKDWTQVIVSGDGETGGKWTI